MTGQKGSSFEMDAFRDYEATTYEAYRSGDGTAVLAGDPFVLISPIWQNGLSSYSGLKTGEEQGLCMCTIPVPARYSK